MRVLRILAVCLVAALLLVHLLLAASVALGSVTGFRYVIVTGGSMDPGIAVGDALILNTARVEAARVGDVVTFRAVGGALTTHRVIGVHHLEGGRFLQTQGDANTSPDPDFVHQGGVIGQPVFRLPYGGYVASCVLSPSGRMLVFLPPLVILLGLQLRVLRTRLRLSRDQTGGSDGGSAGIHPTHRATGLTAVVVVALSVSLVAGVVVAHARAVFVSSDAIGANAVASAVLVPVTGLNAVGGSGGVALSWTQSSDPRATGYEVWKAAVASGPFTRLATITAPATTTYNDTTAFGTTYYVLRTRAWNWLSPNSAVVSGTVPSAGETVVDWRTCTTHTVAVGGDGNGYEAAPAAACGIANGAYATDANSGTTTALACTDTGKDVHVFHGFDLNAISSQVAILTNVKGIEVSLTGRKSQSQGTSQWCVQVSQNGGSTWSPAKYTMIETATTTTLTFGAGNDLWGLTGWAPASFTTANFRTRVVDVSDVPTESFQLDAVAARVTFKSL